MLTICHRAVTIMPGMVPPGPHYGLLHRKEHGGKTFNKILAMDSSYPNDSKVKKK